MEIEDVPYFNAPIYLENKERIGKIDEIFGPIRDYSVTVKLSENMNAKSFKSRQKLFVDPAKLLPISKFLPKHTRRKCSKEKGPNCAIGASRGSGFVQGGRGGNRRGGSARGGFNRGRAGSGSGGNFKRGRRGRGRGRW